MDSRFISIGGATKVELRARLEAAGIRLNELADALFRDERFATQASPARLEIVDVSAAELGLAAGGTFEQVVQQAAQHGLMLCPLETGPHLRLSLLNQAEGALGEPARSACAPPGSITVASAAVSPEDDVPKGFYLRRIQGVLWLRGYRSWAGHHWSPEDRFAFQRRASAA